MPEMQTLNGGQLDGTTSRVPNTDDRIALLNRLYTGIVIRLIVEPLVAQALVLAIWLTMLVNCAVATPASLASALAATLIVTSYWFLAMKTLKRQQLQLETLLVQDAAATRQVLVEWKHDDWKHPVPRFLVQIQPLVWLAAISCTLALVWFSR